MVGPLIKVSQGTALLDGFEAGDADAGGRKLGRVIAAFVTEGAGEIKVRPLALSGIARPHW